MNKIYVINKEKVLKSLLIIAVAFSLLYSMKGYLLNVYNDSNKENVNSVINEVDTSENVLALEFEVNYLGNNVSSLDEVLKILENNNVKATFFITGNFADNNPDSIKKIYEAGHEIGNHSRTHRKLDGLSNDDLANEMKSCHELIKKQVGYEMNLFKFPYDAYTDSMLNKVYDNNYYPIGKSIESKDNKELGKMELINEVITNQNIHKGAIIEFNVGSKYLASSLEEIIKKIKEKGFEIMPVGRIIYYDNYEVEKNGKQVIKEQKTRKLR